MFDQTAGLGLEIGPLYDPVVHRGEADIRYVDVHPGEALKAYYSAHPGVPVDEIVDPDYVLIGPDGPRRLAQACGPADRFAWVIASHVIEHVPDLLGWLEEVAEVLDDDGRLVLAVPDRRYSFDAARPATSVGQVLLAHRHGDQTPSVRAVYDHFSKAVNTTAAEAWDGALPTSEDRIHGLDYVQEQLRLTVDEGVYVDCHVWLFTPQSFVDQLAELMSMDLIEFVVEQVMPTAAGELEFYAVLRRLPRGLESDERRQVLGAGVACHDLDARPALERTRGSEPAREPQQQPRQATEWLLSPREQRLILAKRTTLGRVRSAASRLRARSGHAGRTRR